MSPIASQRAIFFFDILYADMREGEMSGSPKPIEFLGAPASPYTRKMLAYLRYRGIPYRFHISMHDSLKGYPQPKPALFPTFYLPDEAGELQAVTDSTPLIRRFEGEYQGRPALPDDPVTRFLQDIVEDYADEWLTKIMFHYRWAVPENADHVAPLLVYWMMPQAAKGPANDLAENFAARQAGRLGVVGSNDATAATIEASYRRVLACLDDLIATRPFLFGTRPSAADFAIYGQFTQLLGIEPTSAAIARESAPRLLAWIDHLEDATGYAAHDDGWLSRNEAATTLRPLFAEIGRTYAPYMQANAAAHAASEKQVTLEIDGAPWTQATFPYQAKCLRVLRDSFAALSTQDQTAVRDAFDGTGCEVLTTPP
jgi:glutathione S-transferase